MTGAGRKVAYVVATLEPNGAAARAGIRIGETVRAYTLTLTTIKAQKSRIQWSSTALESLNAGSVDAVIGVQVRKLEALSGIWETRASVIEGFRQRKSKQLKNQLPLMEWTVDGKVLEWDHEHFTQLTSGTIDAPAGPASVEPSTTTTSTAPTIAVPPVEPTTAVSPAEPVTAVSPAEPVTAVSPAEPVTAVSTAPVAAEDMETDATEEVDDSLSFEPDDTMAVDAAATSPLKQSSLKTDLWNALTSHPPVTISQSHLAGVLSSFGDLSSLPPPIPQAKLSEVILIADDDDPMDGSTSCGSTVLSFRQLGGRPVRVSLSSNWGTQLSEKEELNDSIVFALCSWIAQAVPYEWLCLLDSAFIVSYIEKGIVDKWPRDHPLICMPVCQSRHWVLLAIWQNKAADETTIFYMDSVEGTTNPDNTTKRKSVGYNVATKVAEFIEKIGTNASVSQLLVPKQRNGYDCGIHVIHNFAVVVKTLNNTECNEEIGAALRNASFSTDKMQNRELLINSMIDAFKETGRRIVYWGQCGDVMWPCYAISGRLAKLTGGSRSRKRGVVPVVWFKRKQSNACCIDKEMKLLKELSLEEALQQDKLSADDQVLLQEAYAQAISYSL